MAYASAADMLNFYDARVVGELVADDNTRVLATDLESNKVLQAQLDAASGSIDAALMVGERYSPDDLANLKGGSLEHLSRVTCDIAISMLLRRRVDQDPERVAAQIQVAETHLDRLRTGVNVFGLAPQKEAGRPTVTGPDTVTYQNLNLLRDRTRNYFPVRRNPNNR